MASMKVNEMKADVERIRSHLREHSLIYRNVRAHYEEMGMPDADFMALGAVISHLFTDQIVSMAAARQPSDPLVFAAEVWRARNDHIKYVDESIPGLFGSRLTDGQNEECDETSNDTN